MLAPSVRVALVRYCITSKDLRVSDCQWWWLTRVVLLPSQNVCSQPFGDLQLFRGWIHKAEELFGAFALDLGSWEQYSVHPRCSLIHSGWQQKVWLTFWVPLLGQAAVCLIYSSVNSLSVVQQWSGNRHHLCGPLPHVLAVFVPLPFWVLILSDLACHMFCLCHWLLGYLNEIFSWDLLCFFAK